MRPLHEGPSYNGAAGQFCPPFSTRVDTIVLGADTDYVHPIPAGAKFVLFSFDGDFRAKLGVSTTTIPGTLATTTDGSGVELTPGARAIPAWTDDGRTVAPTHICLRAPVACKGSLSFYS
jgi:hypothetical protein